MFDPEISETPETASKKRRILVADDSTAIRLFFSRSLEKEGFEVVRAKNGQEAWDKFTKPEETFDMVVSDLEMPKVTGLKLLEKIRDREQKEGLPPTPVLIISGNLDEKTIEQIKKLDSQMLNKPIGADKLKQVVKETLTS